MNVKRLWSAIRGVILELAVPDDFRGRPVALLGNQLGHVFCGMGAGLVLAILGAPGVPSILGIAAAYAVLKEGLVDLPRGASLRDMAADTSFIALGAELAFVAVRGDPVVLLCLWAATAFAAFVEALRAAR